MKYSMIVPMEENRITLFRNTLNAYDALGYNDDLEIVLISRTIKSFEHNKFSIKVINYEWNNQGFSPTIPLNIGLMNTNYDNIIVTSPEVMPLTNVLQQFNTLGRGNYIAQVFEQNENGSTGMSLVNTGFRGDTPAMYFLGLFKKEDLLKINGWCMKYTRANGAYDDNDFGDRFKKSGSEFKICDDILGLHQWHPRSSVTHEWLINQNIFLEQQKSNNYWATPGYSEVQDFIKEFGGNNGNK